MPWARKSMKVTKNWCYTNKWTRCLVARLFMRWTEQEINLQLCRQVRGKSWRRSRLLNWKSKYYLGCWEHYWCPSSKSCSETCKRTLCPSRDRRRLEENWSYLISAPCLGVSRLQSRKTLSRPYAISNATWIYCATLYNSSRSRRNELRLRKDCRRTRVIATWGW